jgi:tetratricopeptide (TPR) repeat protein
MKNHACVSGNLPVGGSFIMMKPSRQVIFAIVIIILSLATAYGNTFSAPFIFDDTINILENTSIRQLWPPWRSFIIPAETGLAGRPIVNLSLAINYAISAEDVWSYHLLNLIIHILATLTFFGIVRQTLMAGRVGIIYAGKAFSFSLACALLWGIHPLQTQAVTYIIQRCESLMALFFMMTLYCALRGWQSKDQNRWHLLAMMSFLFAVGSKEVAVIAPLVFLSYEWVFKGRHPLQSIRLSPLLYTGFTLGVVVALLMAVNGNTLISRTENTQVGLLSYWMTQCQVILHYLRLALWPSNLTFDYGWPVATFNQAWPAVIAVITLLSFSLFFLLKQKALGFLGICFFLILAPSSLIPLPDLAFEHRMYLPLAALIPLIMGAAAHAYLWGRNRWQLKLIPENRYLSNILMILVICLVLPCWLLTLQRNHDYRSAVAIWSDTVKKRPVNFRGYHGLGLALNNAGRVEEGLDNLRRAIKLNPRDAYANIDMGYTLFLLNRPDEAIPFFREAIRSKPLNAKAHNNLGAALARTNRLNDAIFHFSEALKIKPDYTSARNNLLLALSERDRHAGL